MSRIKVDRITDKAGTGAPILVNGMNVTGKSTMGDIVGAAVTFNSITGGSANFSSDVSIGGTLTYEDVKNVDSVGLITARTGIKVTGGGIDVNAGGIDVTADGIKVIAGGIGIGTVTPSNLLEIQGANSAAAIRLTETNHSNLNRYGQIFEYGGSLYFQSRNDTANGDFIFRGGQDGVEKLRIGSSSQIGIAGANYGTAGQVLTSGGPSAAPQWAAVSGGYGTVVDEWNIEGSSNYGTISIPTSGAYLNSGTGWPEGGNQGNTHRTLLHAGSTGVSWNNEVVSFPSTGQWRIEVYLGYIGNASGKIVLIAEKSTDNGSSWNWLRYTVTEQASNSNLYLTSFFNVTNTSNDKVQFEMDSNTQSQASFQCGTSDRTLYNSIIFTKVA